MTKKNTKATNTHKGYTITRQGSAGDWHADRSTVCIPGKLEAMTKSGIYKAIDDAVASCTCGMCR